MSPTPTHHNTDYISHTPGFNYTLIGEMAKLYFERHLLISIYDNLFVTCATRFGDFLCQHIVHVLYFQAHAPLNLLYKIDMDKLSETDARTVWEIVSIFNTHCDRHIETI